MPPLLNPAFPRNVFMTTDAVGGVWTYALELASGLSARGISVEMAVLGPAPAKGQLRAAAVIPGLQLVVTQLALDWTAASEAEMASVAQALASLAHRSRADLVHLHAPGLAGVRPWALPVVASAHSCVGTWWNAVRGGAPPDELAWRIELTGRGMRVVDLVIAPSGSFARQLALIYGNATPIRVVYNGSTRGGIETSRARDCIFTAGRLWDPAKNVDAIDRAAGLLGREIHAAGPAHGPNGEHVGFNHLNLLGSLAAKTLDAWYARTAIFVSMSRYEPFGLSVLEAARSGAALVLSDLPTFRELWSGAALFVALDEPAELARAIEQLDKNPGERDRLALEARRRAARYSSEQMVEGTLDAYRRACLLHTERAQMLSVA